MACFRNDMVKFISYVKCISICLIILFKICWKLSSKFDIISLIAFHVFAALNLYLLQKVVHSVISLLHECSS